MFFKAAVFILAIGCSGSSVVASDVASSSATPIVPDTQLAAGRYRLDTESARVTFDVPEGWDAWAYGVSPRGQAPEAPDGVGLGYWTVDNVYSDSCHWNHALPEPDVGPSVADLVDALVAQRGHPSGDPSAVSLDGFAGTQIEMTVPAHIDFARCWNETFLSWSALPEGGRFHQGPGQIDRLWILDVDGSRLVVDAFYYRATSDADREQLFAIVASTQIEAISA